MSKRGVARGNFRADSSMKWEVERKILAKKMEKTRADEARERMLERENQGKLTAEVEELYMGGADAAEKQAAAWQQVFDDIKAGKSAADPEDSLAGAARKRMMERQEQNGKKDGEHPDIGKDIANRKAYSPADK